LTPKLEAGMLEGLSASVPFVLDDMRAPRLTIRLNGVEVPAILDTGARGTIINWAAAKAIGLIHQSSDDDESDLTGLYQAKILALAGLEDFAQFVFLMHFVATFDEGRHLLMWDDAALTNALCRALRSAPANSRRARRDPQRPLEAHGHRRASCCSASRDRKRRTDRPHPTFRRFSSSRPVRR
jgi:hypothetical protein